MKNILVTGGAGFIGSHLCEALLKKGDKVIVIDNFNDYYDPNIKRNNIKEIYNTMTSNNISKENFQLYEGDIRNQKDINRVFANKIDIVIHLAAMAGVRYSIEKPELYYEVNVIGTLKLLEKCKEEHVGKIIFASSSSVYGNNIKVPFSESDNVDFPISPYAATKKSGELLCYTYHDLYNMSIACLRFFTVYGPRQRPDLAIHKFSKLIIEGKSIPFYGDGSTERDYTYVEDIIAGILETINWINEDKHKFDVFNLGGDHTISLKEMVSTIEKTLGISAHLNIMPMQQGDVNRTCADISHSRTVLGFQPTYNFSKGIANFISWIKLNNADLGKVSKL